MRKAQDKTPIWASKPTVGSAASKGERYCYKDDIDASPYNAHDSLEKNAGVRNTSIGTSPMLSCLQLHRFSSVPQVTLGVSWGNITDSYAPTHAPPIPSLRSMEYGQNTANMYVTA